MYSNGGGSTGCLNGDSESESAVGAVSHEPSSNGSIFQESFALLPAEAFVIPSADFEYPFDSCEHEEVLVDGIIVKVPRTRREPGEWSGGRIFSSLVVGVVGVSFVVVF